MANLNEIIQEINTNLPDNDTQSITAKKLRDTLIYTLYGTEEEYDISANHNGTKYMNLTAALGINGGNVPIDVRKGGMTIRFINNSDEYEQWRYLGTSVENTDFIDVTDWTGIANVSVSKIAEIEESDWKDDLDIVDEFGNILVRFFNGHIKVKNFDSSYISKFTLSEKLKNKKFALIGDSISTFNGWLPSDIPGYDGSTYATYYPRGDVNSVDKTWWYQMCEYIGIDPVTQFNNCAWSGSLVTGGSTSTTNARPACSTRRITDLAARGFIPDIIICWISCNDWGHAVDLGNWQVTDAIPAEGTISEARAAYALMLNKLHTTYPKARIFCCTILDDVLRDQEAGWPSNNANGVSTYQWNQNIREIAEAFGCDVIDLHNCGINYSNIAQYYAVDSGLHPNAAGQKLVAQRIIAELNAKY